MANRSQVDNGPSTRRTNTKQHRREAQELQGRSWIAIDPGRKDIISVAYDDSEDRRGLSWSISNKSYYERCKFNRRTAKRLLWNQHVALQEYLSETPTTKATIRRHPLSRSSRPARLCGHVYRVNEFAEQPQKSASSGGPATCTLDEVS